MAQRSWPDGGKYHGRELGVVGLLVLVGLGARVVAATSGGLWRDEAQMLDVVGLPSVGSMLDFLVQHEAHPPLYYLLMRGWIALAGVRDAAVIIPGVLLGGVSIVAVWRIGRMIESPRTGLTAAALVAISPYLVRSDGMARPYAFLSLVSVGAFGFLWWALVEGSRKALAAWAACSIVLLYTHAWAALLVAGMSFTSLSLTGRRGVRLAPFALGWAVSLILVAWVPWLPSLLRQAAHGGHLREAGPVFRGLDHAFFALPGLPPPASVGLVVAAGLVTILRWPERHRFPAPTGVAVTLAWGSVLFAMTLATVGSRWTELLVPHVIRSLSPLALLGAAAVLCPPAGRGRHLGAVTIGIAIGASGFVTLSMLTQPRSSAKLVAQLASITAGPQDVILLVPSPLASSFLRYYAGSARVEAYPRGVLERPIPFDHWWVRDTSRSAVDSSVQRALEVLRAGGSVWEVATYTPAPLRSASLTLEAKLTELVGPPRLLDEARVRAVLEELTVRIWSRRP